MQTGPKGLLKFPVLLPDTFQILNGDRVVAPDPCRPNNLFGYAMVHVPAKPVLLTRKGF